MANSRSRHRARTTSLLGGVIGSAGVALAGAALLSIAPAVSTGPALLANSSVYYLQGTKIGDTTSHPAPYVFTTEMMSGAGETAPDPADFHFVDYPATIGPFSNGGFRDPSWGVSVGRGIAALGEQPHSGDTVFGFSQGAVVATAYKRDHLANGVNYVLVENPARPNGGIFERFHGLYVPLLDINFSGATPVVREPADGSGTTVDIARQYDGWADFPKYPLNVVATANAVLGIIYLHGGTQDLDEDAVKDIDKTDSRYYQQHGDTTYYLIPTRQLPLLMPLNGLLPKSVLAKLDAPLRALVELGYDRSDYSKSTPAQLLPPIGHSTAAAAEAAVPAPKRSADPKPAPEATDDTPKPARTSLPSRIRQSGAAITARLRSLTGKKPAPGAKKPEPATPETGATHPDPPASQPKTHETTASDPGTDKPDAA
ncbi:PE-PPE domain-containing protein [Mycobacterium sp. BMJ-28]